MRWESGRREHVPWWVWAVSWTVAAVVLVLVAQQRAEGAPLVPGPTPDGAGFYGYCRVNRHLAAGANEYRLRVRCSYGIPSDGATVVGVEFYRDSYGWQRLSGSATVPACSSVGNSGVTGPIVTADGTLAEAKCQNAPLPDAIRLRFSTGEALPASLWLSSTNINDWPTYPAYGFRSGITGVADPVRPTFADGTAEQLEAGRVALSGWVAGGIAAVGGVAIAGAGALLLVRYLRRMGNAATLDDVDASERATLGDEFGDEHWSDGGSDDSVDDQGDEDDEERDDGSSEGTADAGDVDECVSCGAELEYGWDADACPECAAV